MPSTQVHTRASHQRRGSRHYDIEEIRRRVNILDVLTRANAHIRTRNRADCSCEGRSTGTRSFNQKLSCCHRCHGGDGDVFSLYQFIYSCSFADAVGELAATAGITPMDADRMQLHGRYRQQALQAQAALEFKPGLRDLRLHYREQIHCYERILHDTRERMNVEGISKEDWETCGNVVSLALDELREAVAAYFLLSFGTISEQREFLENPEWRPAALNGLLARGIVRDDQGHTMEVSLP
jgi:hypothetical protein